MEKINSKRFSFRRCEVMNNQNSWNDGKALFLSIMEYWKCILSKKKQRFVFSENEKRKFYIQNEKKFKSKMHLKDAIFPTSSITHFIPNAKPSLFTEIHYIFQVSIVMQLTAREKAKSQRRF